MPRSHRISRGLIGLLVVVIALGLVFYFNNVRRSKASETPAPQTVAAPPQSQRAPATPDAASRFSGMRSDALPNPSTNPATRPARPLGSSGRPGNASPLNNTTGAGAPGVPTAASVSEALAKFRAGDLPAARTMLNNALLAGKLSATELEEARRTIAEINKTMVFSPRVFPGDTFATSHTVRSGELLKSIADRNEVPWELIARVNNLSDPRKLRAGQTIKVVRGPFHAVVSKSRFSLDVYFGPAGERGSMYVASFPVGLGADDSTPTGSWIVEPHKKIKNPTYFSPRGEGVIDADDPKNPLGERWIGLVGTGGGAVGRTSYGIHGTIEPQSIGRQMSMGCIRMKNEDAELVYDMLVEGKSTVVVQE